MTAIQTDYSWLTWGVMDVPNGGLSPEQLAALAAERERAATLPVLVSALPTPRSSSRDARSTWRPLAVGALDLDSRLQRSVPTLMAG